MFNEYFIPQYIAIDKGCSILQDPQVTSNPLNDFVISDKKILNMIRSLNPNKTHGWDEISVRMIKLRDNVLVLPLKMIFKLLEAWNIP